jgi:predicted nucleic acid-binding protein
MRSMVLDTDVVSYIYKKDTRAALYEPHLVNAVTVISFMTLAEMEKWTIAKNWGARRRANMLQKVLGRFAVIESDHALCRRWAVVTETARRAGRKIETADAWIAATALLYDSELVTHNAADFNFLPGLKIITES